LLFENLELINCHVPSLKKVCCLYLAVAKDARIQTRNCLKVFFLSLSLMKRKFLRDLNIRQERCEKSCLAVAAMINLCCFSAMWRYRSTETEIRMYAVEITYYLRNKIVFGFSQTLQYIFFFFYLAWMLLSVGHHQAIFTKLRITCW